MVNKQRLRNNEQHFTTDQPSDHPSFRGDGIQTRRYGRTDGRMSKTNSTKPDPSL
jgi:hypothetical protein